MPTARQGGHEAEFAQLHPDSNLELSGGRQGRSGAGDADDLHDRLAESRPDRHLLVTAVGRTRLGRNDCTICGLTRYLHTMYRITDPERSRAFYEALGFEFRRELPIVRDGHHEATNYFFGIPGQEEELELTYNTDGRTYELGTGYGHVALAVDDLDATLARLKEQGIEPEREPYRVREGGSRLCFVRDPDDYRIELIDRSGR